MTITWALEYNVEVQTEDTNGRVILDTQINVLLNSKTEISVGREVVTTQLVLTDLMGGMIAPYEFRIHPSHFSANGINTH